MAKARKKTKASTLRAGKKRGATKSPKSRPKTQIVAAPNKDIAGKSWELAETSGCVALRRLATGPELWGSASAW